GRIFGNTLQLLAQREGIQLTHVLIGVHAYPLFLCSGHTHLQIGQNHQPLRRAQPGHALIQQARARITNTRTGFQHRRTIGLLSPATYAGRARRRTLDKGAYLLALHHHVLEVRRKTAALEPVLPPDLHQQRCELTEMGWPFDRASAEAELLGHIVIMDRGMATVLLISQHLFWLAQRAAQVKRGIETHVSSPQPLSMALRRSRIMPSASAMMRSTSCCTVGTSRISPATMPQDQAPASISPVFMMRG